MRTRSVAHQDVLEQDSADLIARVLSGDVEAFHPLVTAYEPAVYGLCRKLLGWRSEEAEDLAQETFVRAYRYLPRLSDPRRFGPWLYRIARSLCRDRRRRADAERRALLGRAEEMRSKHQYSATACRVEDRGGYVDEALAELPTVECDVLTLRYYGGLTYRELADRLDLTHSQVDHLIRKARRHLAHRLEVRFVNEL